MHNVRSVAAMFPHRLPLQNTCAIFWCKSGWPVLYSVPFILHLRADCTNTSLSGDVELIMPNRVVIFSKKLCVGSVSDCVKTLINKIPKSAPLACCKRHGYYTVVQLRHDTATGRIIVHTRLAPIASARQYINTLINRLSLLPRSTTLRGCSILLEVSTINFKGHVTRQLDSRLFAYLFVL